MSLTWRHLLEWTHSTLSLISNHARLYGSGELSQEVNSTYATLIKKKYKVGWCCSLSLLNFILSMAPSVERFLSISCTNVGVGPGGTTNLLAYNTPLVLYSSSVLTNLIMSSRRLAIVDYRGATVFDKFVSPTTTVCTIQICLRSAVIDIYIYNIFAFR